ncbi:MAG: J domain-containing protein [Hyphomicrobiaceae bacterium]|nr:J domain-containing protein [Hyphomicrobiaceae bacterium]
MFERNKVDNIEHNGVPVEITTDCGDVLSGRLLMPVGRGLVEALNSPGAFLEFEAWGGERTFIAKASMRNVRLVQAPRPQSLKGRLEAADGFDPHTILGVRAGSGLDDVKAAWHRLSKAYHPDRYASAELPIEVLDYLSAMARRINAAYAALEGPLLTSRRMAALRQPPVYESRPRG